MIFHLINNLIKTTLYYLMSNNEEKDVDLFKANLRQIFVGIKGHFPASSRQSARCTFTNFCAVCTWTEARILGGSLLWIGEPWTKWLPLRLAEYGYAEFIGNQYWTRTEKKRVERAEEKKIEKNRVYVSERRALWIRVSHCFRNLLARRDFQDLRRKQILE